MKIIGIAGSLRPGAYIHRLLEAATRELPASVDVEIWDGLNGVPPLTDGPLPSSVDQLCHALSGANGMLVAAPAHSALPAELCHVLDWVSSRRGGAVLVGKPVAVVTACLRAHEAMWTQTELRRALASAGALVYGADLVVPPVLNQFDAEGRLVDQEFRERLRPVLAELCVPSMVKSSA
ncbi:NADPH-dependent FMN reductase [Streptosporangium carneum]|uniref:FMN reductase n=1 Tax=Streptosporangium carneum TaxID=47481 RepID=A0A9W6IAE2_9ACTN|nr:NAD(P)H-dependent oxidoreductase [Streptosporangium carneum]GLK13820.1 FMN reductase [Streptosporangium carneum]